MEVIAVFRDGNAHCAIRVDVTTRHTFFIHNDGTEYTISKLTTEEFNRCFDLIEHYDPKKAARKYLSNPFTPSTSAARTQLNAILEDTMSETKTFRAPVSTGAKTLPNKVQPIKATAAKIAADPKAKVTALKTAEKTAKASVKEAAKAEPKKAAAKVPAKASGSPKASPKAASATQGDLYATKVVATKQAQEAREGSFFAKLADAAAKPITLDALITTLAKDKTIFRDKTGAEALASLKVRCRDAFTRLGYLQAAK